MIITEVSLPTEQWRRIALTNGRLIQHRRASQQADCSKRSVTQCVRVRIEREGRDPIEIALDCRVQITRRHLQIAAFKPHSNPPSVPTREIKLIRTFGQRSKSNCREASSLFFISFFLSFRGEEWRGKIASSNFEGINILRERLKSWVNIGSNR